MELYSHTVRSAVWQKTAGRCFYCGTQTDPFKTFWIDHMRPRSRGGNDELENLVPSCLTCNRRKGKRTVEQFRQMIARYHRLATTKEFADYRREKFHCDDHVYRLVFYFEVLETSDEEKLKQGAERLFYFRDPEYMTQRDNRIFWRDYPFGHC